ncbi:cytochrome P450 [Flammula alnicola]|nr:cytochrome P450 [Flammula alnicola]
MGDLPPGIAYLIQRSPRILSPPALTYVVLRFLESAYDVPVSAGLLTLGMVLSLPLALTISVMWDEFYIRFDAAKRGAVLPPRVGDPYPGSLGALIKGIKTLKTAYPGDGFEELCEKLGGYTFNRRILFENRIITAEPEYIKAILATQFDEFEKGPEIRYLFHPLLGTGVFAVDGELWKFHRSMTRPFFSRDRISHFDNFDRHAEDAIRQLKHRLREGHPVDFQDLIARFTLDSATEFLFGNDVGSLSGGLPYPYYVTATGPSGGASSDGHPASRFVRAFSEAQSITSFRMRFGVHWPLMEFWQDKLKKPIGIVHDFIDPIVGEAIKRKREAEARGIVEKDRDDETLLENLVNSTEDPITLRDEIMSLLVAGRDTTASALTFTVYMLAEHPDVLRRLREEILRKIGPQRRPTYDDFRDMKYMKAVINETLRLYPVVPFNIRISKKATTWPSKTPGGKPFYIPANTRTPYGVFMMHRRKDLWGPDALEFDPDRFLDDRLHKYLTPNPFIFLPFNAGPRICLGQQFAYHEASFFLVRLLQNFSAISLAPAAQPPGSRAPADWAQDKDARKAKEKIRPKTHLTMYVQDGLWITMQEVKPGEEVGV